MVIGDVMLDQYITGNAHRISPEAPVPVVHVTGNHFQPGGAGNVAANLASLGCQTTLIGLVGKDKHATTLSKILDQRKVDGILLECNFPTITKVRIISHAQQLLRLDYESYIELNDAEEKKLVDSIKQLIPFHQVIILSDYAKGTLSEKVCRQIISTANKNGIPVITDPKSKTWEKYGGSHIITPNFSEYNALLEKPIENEDEQIAKSGKKLIKESGAHYILVTRSDKGMSLIKPDKTEHWPAQNREVYDVSGAGDTVIATLSACIASGLSVEQAVKIANIAAGIVVGKFGTATITSQELNDYMLE